MLYLLLALLCSALLGFQFKLHARFQIDTFQAILFNYGTCVACATLHLGRFPVPLGSPAPAWMPFALMLGFVFITGFNTAALTVRYFGVTISQIMQKMTIVAGVPFAIFWYGESAGSLKIMGVLMAIAAIVLVNWPQKQETPRAPGGPSAFWLWFIPLITWVLSSVIDITFLHLQNAQLTQPGDIGFISTIFGTAGVFGCVYAAYAWASGRLHFAWKNVLAGICLGVPNYGSILFILLGLGSGLEGSVFFPLCNVGIIVTTSIGAVLLFGEKMSAVNWVGIGLAVGAIVLISM